MIIRILQGGLILIAAYFLTLFIRDFNINKNTLENNSWGKVLAIGFFANFFDTLGIGSFAPLTALLKGFKQTEDRVMPGTLNVGCTIPVILEAFIFISVIEVEPITLVSMLITATIGAWIGAGVVAKMSEKKIQKTMGIALIVTAVLMLLGKFELMPTGGEDLGLTGMKLIVAIVGNFIFGALMTAGIGLYAPCMVLVYLLGMSSRVAFPIMMGSCAFLMPVASIKFIKEGAYDRKASMGITLGGVIGVFIAAYIVKELPLNALEWLVIFVVLYTASTMLRSAMKKNEVSDIKSS